jgi:hypothetical protein
MTNTISIEPMIIMHTMLFKFILAYVFGLELISSQSKDQSIFKNIFLRIFTNFIIFVLLGFDMMVSAMYSLVFTTLFFIIAEK